MGFLDNSGDIILDAVLTDLGRKRLAEGNFTVAKFAVGDDEINYGLYNKTHPSGSAYYDLEIIQTPVLESFTNNTSTMNSRLVTLTNNNILYLPVQKLNTQIGTTAQHSTGIHLIAVDNKTQGTDITNITSQLRVGKTSAGQREGVLFGLTPQDGKNFIQIDQGFDNEEVPTNIGQFQEDQYIIQIDGRLGTIVDESGQELGTQTPTGPSSQQYSAPVVDDDGIVLYTVRSTDPNTVITNLNDTDTSPIAGAKGTKIMFKVKASEVLTQNQSFFDRLGFTTTINSISCKAIDTNIRITGVKFGYTIDIPVRFVKDIS